MKRNPTSPESITWEEAIELMEKIKELESLKFDFSNNGCFQRCFLIRRLLEAKQIPNGHAYITFASPYRWKHHAAPFATISTGQRVIFDPAELDQPITIEDWEKHWGKKGIRLERFDTTITFKNKPPLMSILDRLDHYAQMAMNQA